MSHQQIEGCWWGGQPTTANRPDTQDCADTRTKSEDDKLIKDQVERDATVFGVSPAMFTLCSGIALLHDALDHMPGPIRDDALEAAVDVIEGAMPEGEAGQWLVGKLRRGE
jgi:hypothetical protein